MNTAYLYVSSFIGLFLGLYTSRILLQTLGVTDFGLYGVVGSIVTLLGFLNVAMGSASSRFLTYELAKGNIESQRKVFSAVFLVHIFLAFCLFMLAETAGLWYLVYKLEVPDSRMNAAHWVYQTSVLIGILNIVQVPYNALINAHERMGFSSFWNTVGTLLKFLGVFILYWITFDKLIYYAIMTFSLSLITFYGFWFFCNRKFQDCKFIHFHDKELFKEMLSFAGFSAFSSSSSLIRTQGAALLINKFFGVAINASANIANMVAGYISGFTQNVIAAFRPQIIKCYANNNIVEMQDTVNQCLKYSIAIFTFVAIPITIEMNYILSLWLGIVPNYSDIFCRIGMVGSIAGIVTMIMTIVIQATSKVRNNSLFVSLNSFFSLAITFLFLYLGYPAYIVFAIYSLTEIINVSISMWNIKVLIHDFLFTKLFIMLVRLAALIACSAIIPLIILWKMEVSFSRLFLVTFSYMLSFGVLFWLFMLEESAKAYILLKIRYKR